MTEDQYQRLDALFRKHYPEEYKQMERESEALWNKMRPLIEAAAATQERLVIDHLLDTCQK